MDEDFILTLVALETELAKLRPEHRDMMLLIYKVQEPEDWPFAWPPRFEDIGVYIGLKYRGRALSEAAIRYRRDQVEAMWRGERGDLRQSGDEKLR